MPREASFTIDFDIPRNSRDKIRFKYELQSLVNSVGCYGKAGRAVGLGFAWETQTGLADQGLAFLMTLCRRMNRAFLAVGLLSRDASVYITGARIEYTRSEPKVVFTLEEDR